VKDKPTQAKHCVGPGMRSIAPIVTVSRFLSKATTPTAKSALVPVQRTIEAKRPGSLASVKVSPFAVPILPTALQGPEDYLALVNRTDARTRYANAPLEARQALLVEAQKQGMSPGELFERIERSREPQSDKQSLSAAQGLSDWMDLLTIAAVVATIVYFWRKQA